MSLIFSGILFFLLASAFFSAAEIISITANRFKLEHLKEEGDRRAGRILDLIRNPDKIIAAVLVGNNVAHVACTALTTLLLSRLFSKTPNWQESIPFLTTLALTPLMLIFGEMVPKSVGRLYANSLIYLIELPLKLLLSLFHPLLYVISKATSFMFRLFGIEDQSAGIMISREEFSHWVSQSVKSGEVQKETGKMIQFAFEFRETLAREIMVPLTEIRAISVQNQKLSDGLNFAKKYRFTRYPVYFDRIDKLIGYINIYDLLAKRHEPERFLSDFVRPFSYIPNTLPVDKLFYRMQKHREKIVVVVDEYGGCDGMITLEDIMEELVGDIAQEHEEVLPDIRRVSETQWLIDASLDIDDLNEELQMQIPEGPWETLGGFLMTSLQRIPVAGDVVEIPGWRFEILEMDQMAVSIVRLERA